MVQYIGNKKSVAKQILPIILKDRTEDQYFIDLFCGGCNLLDQVQGKRIANDLNYPLIQLWKALQRGWEPPSIITKEQYQAIKLNQDFYSPELVAFVGFLCSFGGKWFGGYAHNAQCQNYAQGGKNVLLKQIQRLKDVEFLNQDYYHVSIPDNSIIYLDPPYKGTTSYKGLPPFNTAKMWDYCREKTKEGHKVYISEYKAPEDFECLIEIPVRTKLNKNQLSNRIERLYTCRK